MRSPGRSRLISISGHARCLAKVGEDDLTSLSFTDTWSVLVKISCQSGTKMDATQYVNVPMNMHNKKDDVSFL